jgi:hypothetical protein
VRGHIRTVKPEIFQDEKLWDLSQETGFPLLQAFEGLWCYADREGRFEWRPRALKNLILPYWQGDFACVLDALERGRFIVRYTTEGHECGFVRNFGKHQVINQREAKSLLPAPPDVLAPEDPPRAIATHVHAHGEWKGKELEGKGAGKEGAGAPALAPEVPGLTVVHPGPLPPSRREQEAAERADRSTHLKHEYDKGWVPTQANQMEGRSLGLSDEEIWTRWDLKKNKYYDKPFRSNVKQFNCELAWAAQDKKTASFQQQTRKAREDFELPGRGRSAAR